MESKGNQELAPNPPYYDAPPQYPGQPDAAYPPAGMYQQPQGANPPSQQGIYPPQQGTYPPQQGTYPPQQGTYPPQGVQGVQQAVVIQPSVVLGTAAPKLGPGPQIMTCRSCHATITTSIRYETGAFNWIVVGGVCIFLPCLWFGCQLIPLCMSSLKDVQHTCPNCHASLGCYRRLD